MTKSITCGKKDVMRKWLLVVCSLVIAGLVIRQKIYWPKVQKPNNEQVRITPEPTINPLDYLTEQEFADWGIKIVLPSNWDKKSENDSVIFTANAQSVRLAGLAQLVISKVSSPPPGQKIATAKEFDIWYKKESSPASEAGEYKSGNLMINGNKAVKIIYLEPENDFYSLTVWWRQDNANYYFTAMGNGKPGAGENEVFDWLAGQIKEI